MFAAVLLAAAALIGAAQAAADPDDLVPYCSGAETPMNNGCRYAPDQGYMDSAPGANPDLPLGLNPGNPPAV